MYGIRDCPPEKHYLKDTHLFYSHKMAIISILRFLGRIDQSGASMNGKPE